MGQVPSRAAQERKARLAYINQPAPRPAQGLAVDLIRGLARRRCIVVKTVSQKSEVTILGLFKDAANELPLEVAFQAGKFLYRTISDSYKQWTKGQLTGAEFGAIVWEAFIDSVKGTGIAFAAATSTELTHAALMKFLEINSKFCVKLLVDLIIMWKMGQLTTIGVITWLGQNIGSCMASATVAAYARRPSVVRCHVDLRCSRTICRNGAATLFRAKSDRVWSCIDE